MKIISKFIGLFMLSAAFASCGNNSTDTASSTSDSSSKMSTMDTMKSMDTSKSAMSADMSANGDQDVINNLVDKNTKEMDWLKAGMKNGTDKQLKMHAGMMLKDHEGLGIKVKDLVTKKGWNMPAPPDTTGVVNLTEKPGMDWDKAWNNKMVDDHQALLDYLKGEEGTVKDADLKSLVTNTEPVVQSHLDIAKSMKDKMK